MKVMMIFLLVFSPCAWALDKVSGDVSGDDFEQIFQKILTITQPKKLCGKEERKTKLTYYCPHDKRHRKMEGGAFDSHGHRVATLQDYFSGKSKFVTVAVDLKVCKYGSVISSPDIDQLFVEERKKLSNPPKPIPLACLDTGGKFKNKSFTHLDIAVADQNCNVKHDEKDPLTQKLDEGFNVRNVKLIPFKNNLKDLENKTVEHE